MTEWTNLLLEKNNGCLKYSLDSKHICFILDIPVLTHEGNYVGKYVPEGKELFHRKLLIEHIILNDKIEMFLDIFIVSKEYIGIILDQRPDLMDVCMMPTSVRRRIIPGHSAIKYDKKYNDERKMIILYHYHVCNVGERAGVYSHCIRQNYKMFVDIFKSFYAYRQNTDVIIKNDLRSIANILVRESIVCTGWRCNSWIWNDLKQDVITCAKYNRLKLGSIILLNWNCTRCKRIPEDEDDEFLMKSYPLQHLDRFYNIKKVLATFKISKWMSDCLANPHTKWGNKILLSRMEEICNFSPHN